MEYQKGLVTLLQAVMLSDGLAEPPAALCERVLVGVTTPDAVGRQDPYFTRKLRHNTLKQATGVDLSYFSSAARPSPAQLLQHVTVGMLAACDRSGHFPLSKDALMAFLEDAFTCVASKGDERVYERPFDALGLDLRMLQFGIMLVLCSLYRQAFVADRSGGVKYLFRHEEAARIMVIVSPKLYQGYAEVAWNELARMLHGVTFATPQGWSSARGNAQRAVTLAAQAGNDFAMARSLYDLAFLMAVGFVGDMFNLGEVKQMLFDVDQIEARLEAWGMRDALHFHSSTRRYLLAVKAEWERPLPSSADAGRAGQSRKRGGGSAVEVRKTDKANWPVTDWRCFDQRHQGYYTWLEPPSQEEDTLCAGCGIPLLRVHRCDTCKSAPFCSSICAVAQMDKHNAECFPAPKPWLAAPGCRPPPALPQLGEEGYLGCIPWSILRYGSYALLSYAIFWLLERVEVIRSSRHLQGWSGSWQAVVLLVSLWLKALGLPISDEPEAVRPPDGLGEICGADGIDCSAEFAT